MHRRFRRWVALGLLSLCLTLGLGWGPSLAGESPGGGDRADALALPEEESPRAITPEGDLILTLPEVEEALDPESPRPDEIAPDPKPDTMAEVGSPSSETGEEPLRGLTLSDRQRLLIAADEAYLGGERGRAIALYQEAKADLWEAFSPETIPEPILTADQLPPAAAVYWREVNAGLDQGLALRTSVPLGLLVTEYPQFLPAQRVHAQQLVAQGQLEAAAAAIERALMLYPSQPDLLQAQVEVYMAQERWLEASITARQFALLNPDHPQGEAMVALAEENMNRFRGQMNQQLTQNFVGNLLTGAASVLLTGGLFGPFTALNSATILLQGEDALGDRIAQQVKAQLPLLGDGPIDEYVDSMGQHLAALAGRDEFTYEFHVLEDEDLNAFALPGGKIFINSGALTKTHSEAELAGLVAHEIGHAVLSHGFQMATSSNLLGSLASFIPIPDLANIAAGLAITGYSRQMERQADVLGTQLLASSGYAADGLHNLMVILQRETGDRSGFRWFATHPAPDERVAYLQQLVSSGGYNRFAYEGVANHLAMQQRLRELTRGDRHHHDPQVNGEEMFQFLNLPPTTAPPPLVD